MKYLSVRNTLLVGFCVFIVGFLYDMKFAGLPFQDPTPSMQAEWLFHSKVASKIILTGIVLVMIGVLALLKNFIISFVKGRG